MSIQSRIRVLRGVFGLLVSLLLLSLAYGATAGALPASAAKDASAATSNEPPHAATVRDNLRRIAYALAYYRVDNNDDLPPRLSMLYPTYISDPAAFWNPGDNDPCPATIDNDEPDRPNSTQVSFGYVRKLGKVSRPFIVLQDNSLANNAGHGLYAVRLDGMEVRWFQPAPDPPSWTGIARTRLHALGQAMATYASEHNGDYPDKLSKLYPTYLSEATTFFNPGATWLAGSPPSTINNDDPGLANSSQITFNYLGAGYDSTSAPGTVLLADNSPSNNGGAVINLLTADMTVSTCIQTISYGCNSPCAPS